MKTLHKKLNQKGSVLIAVIGILSVLSIMALRFNVEMETAMIKTQGKNLSSDVKVLAESGLQYIISILLKDGSSADQLAIEEEVEYNKTGNVVGKGVSEITEKYNLNWFYGGKDSTTAANYIPGTINLYPGTVNYLIEDLSGKLPIGHVSQFFQRHLLSTILCHYLTGSAPSSASTIIQSELFEDTEATEENGFDLFGSTSNRYIYTRSLIPYDFAKALKAVSSTSTDHLNYAGLPLTDGILASEELGTSYTRLIGKGSSLSKKIATDFKRGVKDTALLAAALTQYSRFIHDTKYDVGSPTSKTSNVSYVSLNPMVMNRQNPKLYSSLFYFDATDYRLKHQFSVGFEAVDSLMPPPGVCDTDNPDATNPQIAIVKPDLFKNGSTFNNYLKDGMIVSGMPGISLPATDSKYPGSALVYNARNEGTDLNSLPPAAVFSYPAPVDDGKVRMWGDREFSGAPNAETAYYVAMKHAVGRLERAFKGTSLHTMPADNVLCPVITRKSLEIAIIKAVFGNAILFTGEDINNPGKTTLIDTTNPEGSINYTQMFNAIENGQVDLANVIFVENAFYKHSSNANDASMAAKYFVPFWQNYKEGVTDGSTIRYEAATSEVCVPSFGFHYDTAEKKFVNYLPHPQTDQKQLAKVYVSLAAAYSVEYDGSVLNPPGTLGGNYNIPKLYNDNSNATANVARFMDGVNEEDAYLDLISNTIVKLPAPTPAEGYVKLYDTNVSTNEINFKPADFTPYETKIRMTVLVNLLNAIIPQKISPTENVAGDQENDTLFSVGKGGSAAKNLKEFIYFEDNQYRINDTSAPNKLPQYMFDGGIRTPGMTFWKFGVHSTTFQCTVDAFKYDDHARLNAVVTFDMYDNDFDTSKPLATDNPHTAPKYKLDYAVKKDTEVFSTIFLLPKGRKEKAADNFIIGNGLMRYPTPKNTDSWRIINYVWSDSYGRDISILDDYFTPLTLYPESVANAGPAKGSWEFIPHPAEPVLFDKFFMDNSNISRFGIGNDYSTGSLKTRKYVCGAGTWVQWEAKFSGDVKANKLNVVLNMKTMNNNLFHTGAAHGSYNIKITRKKDMFTVLNTNITPTKSSPSAYSVQVPVDVKKGDYIIKLTVNKDSWVGSYDYDPEWPKFIQIYEK